ncbi:MAG: hypothetical protein PHU14_08645 [Methylovulum sp.]|nr:hypothetical protein [Methylovulum sp.]
MSKTVSELATEILVAALNSKQIHINGSTTSSGANDIASAYRIIYAAVETEVTKSQSKSK